MPFRRFTAAELVLTQRAYLERPLLLVVLLGAVSFALAEGSAAAGESRGILFLALSAAAVAINAVALRVRSEVWVPRAVVNTAVVGATVLFAIDFLRAPEVLYALGHYLMLIQACKLLEQKRNSDYVQILALSLVLMIAGAMASDDLWFGLLLLAYMPLAIYVAMVLTLKRQLDGQAAAMLAVERAPIEPHRVAWNVSTSFPRRQLWRGAVGASLLCLVTATVVFLLMPRGRAGCLVPMPFARARGAMTGFSASLRLTDLGRIRPDRRVVMRVRVEGPDGSALAAGSPLYLRGQTYEFYAEGAWGSAIEASHWWRMEPSPSLTAERIVRQHVTMDPSLLPAVFALAPLVWLDSPVDPRVMALHPDQAAEVLGPGVPVRYTAYSLAGSLTSAERHRLAATPSYLPADPIPRAVPPGIAALAREWCQDILEAPAPGRDERDEALAQRILQRLGGYSYTLDVRFVDPSADPVEDFLRNSKRGHCELFASAMTLMCRALGVRCRLAGGYMSDEYSAAAGAYLVRGSDAHAWCEVFTEGRHWQTYDPTPPGGREGPGGAVGAMRRAWDTVAFFWKSRVMGYGETDRMSVFGRFLRAFDRAWRGVAAWLRELWVSLRSLLRGGGRVDWVSVAILGASLGGAIGAWVAIRSIVVRRRKAAPRALRPRGLPGFYRRLLKVLERHGCRQRPSQTAQEYLAAAADALALPPDSMETLAGLLYRWRWGRARLSREALTAAEAQVAGVARRLRRPPQARRH